MDIGNILVVCCIWNSGVTIGDQRLRGGEFFRMITERARELLTTIKSGVLMQTNIQTSPRHDPDRAKDSVFQTHAQNA
jgi:hypothetical protein